MQRGKIASTRCGGLSFLSIRCRILPSPSVCRTIGRCISAILPLAFLIALSGSPAYGNGATDYIDANGSTSGFGAPTGTINQSASDWDTSNLGTGTVGAFVSGDQLTFGAAGTDLSSATFSVGMTGTSFSGILVNSTSANITLTGTIDSKLSSSQNWTVAAGSTLIDNATASTVGAGTGMDFNNEALTLAGGGTITFETMLGNTESAVVTENGASTLVVNLQSAATGTGAGAFSGGFALTAGTLNFATAASANAFSQFSASSKTFAINGGTIDNTSGSMQTLSLGSGTYSIGGSFAFTGSSPLNFGTAAVTLNASPTITINSASNPLTIGGPISGATFSITEAGSGTLILSGNNANYGTANVTTTTISGGTLQVGNTAALGAGTVDVAGTSSLTSGPTLAFSIAGTSSISNNISLTGTVATGVVSFISVPSSDTVTLSGNIGGTKGQLCVTGGGTLILSSGSNQYAGGTVIGQSAGSATTLQASSFASVGNGSGLINIDNGTFDFTSTNSSVSTSQFGVDAFGNTPANCTIEVANSSTTLTLSTSLSGSAASSGFTKSGPGTLALGVANTYSGGTIVSAGFLLLSASAAVQDSVVSLTGGSIVFNSTVSSHAFTFGDLSGSGNLALQDNATPTTHAVALTIGGSGDSPTYSGALSDAGSLTKVGSGTVTLTGPNSYTGLTTLSAGSLILSGSAASGTLATSGITVNGGTFAFSPSSATTLTMTSSTLTLGGGAINFDIGSAGVTDQIAANALSLTSDSAFSFTAIGAVSSGTVYTLATYNTLNNSGSFTISGQVVGRLNLTPVIGPNAITVTPTLVQAIWNSNAGGNWSSGAWLNYTPGTAGDAVLFGSSPGLTGSAAIVVDAHETVGTMTFNNTIASYTIGALGSSNLTLDNGASSAVVAVQNGGSHTIAENVALNSNVLVSIDPTATLSISGALSDGANGPSSLTKNGTGILNLTGANSYTGGTTITAGTLRLGDQTSTTVALSGSGGIAVNGTLVVEPAANATITIGNSLTGSGNITVNGSSTLAASPSAVVFSGTTTGFTGSWIISGGCIQLGGGSNLGAATDTITVNGNSSGGGELSFTTGTVANPITINGVGANESAGNLGAIRIAGGTYSGSITLGSNASISAYGSSGTISGPISDSAGGYTLTLGTQSTSTSGGTINVTSANNLYSGGTIILGANVAANAVGALGTGSITLSNATSDVAATALTENTPNALTGANSLVVQAGTATLSQSNNYSAGTILSGGALCVNNSGALGSGSLTINGGTLDNSSGSPVAVSGISSISIGGSFVFTGSSSLDLGTAPVTFATTPTITLSSAVNSLTIGGTISGTGFNVNGPGMLILTGSNLSAGGMQFNGGTLAANAVGALGSGNLAINAAGNGPASVVNVNANQTIGGLSGTLTDGATAASATVAIAAGQMLSVNQSGTGSFPGTLNNSGTLVMQGAGTLEFTGAPTLNTNSALTISSGTLRFNNTTAGSGASIGSNVTATIAAGATLQLAGTVSALSDATHPGVAANISMQGAGILSVTGTGQSVGTVIGEATNEPDGSTIYSGSTVVGDGYIPASLTATQILQSTLTINAGSTVTILPSGPVTSMIAPDNSSDAKTSSAADEIATAASFSESESDSFAAIQADIESGSFSSPTRQRLENRLAAIERLAASDPGLDVNLLENSLLSSIASSTLVDDATTNLTESDESAFGTESSSPTTAAATIALPSSAPVCSPLAVPESSSIVLAAATALILTITLRQRRIQIRFANARHCRD